MARIETKQEDHLGVITELENGDLSIMIDPEKYKKWVKEQEELESRLDDPTTSEGKLFKLLLEDN